MSGELDWLADRVAERQARQARLDAELADLAGDAPAEAEPVKPVQPVATVLPFRRPTPWPHAWNSKNTWHGKGWNAGKVWQGRPRVLITNRSARTGTDDDEPPPMAA